MSEHRMTVRKADLGFWYDPSEISTVTLLLADDGSVRWAEARNDNAETFRPRAEGSEGA